MKKRLALSDLSAGMKFTEDVLLDEKNLFVPAGIAIRQKDLDMLSAWGVTHVMSSGEPVEERPAEAGEVQEAERADGIRPNPFAGDRELYREYVDMVDRLAVVFDRVGRGEKVEPRTVDSIVQDLLRVVRDKQADLVSAILSGEIAANDYARAGVDTAILSIVVGTAIKLPTWRLAYLATGALLHDLGMARVPESIVKKKGELAEDELQKMRAHPLLSYRIITKELMYPDEVGLPGLQHHERWDGEGYPRRSPGKDVDLLSRIVSVVDAFEAMVSEKPYRNSMIGYAAMKNLLSDNSRRFDPEILKAFIRAMGIYPIGSLVLLNNAAIAKVVGIHADAPLRPKIRVVVDEFGKRYGDDEGEILDLLKEKTIFVARALDPRDVARK